MKKKRKKKKAKEKRNRKIEKRKCLRKKMPSKKRNWTQRQKNGNNIFINIKKIAGNNAKKEQKQNKKTLPTSMHFRYHNIACHWCR